MTSLHGDRIRQTPVDALDTAAIGHDEDVWSLRAEGVTLAYGGEAPVVRRLSLDVPRAGLTVVVGPNGCGKSTVLKALGRIVTPAEGDVILHGRSLRRYRGKAVARRLALLPQTPIAPERITVRDLVGRSRYPHHSLLRQWSDADDAAVAGALESTGLTDSADRQVGELSGGQRQRAWFAMVLAQETDIVLLDEPTTFLDISHQYELLELCARLHLAGRTIVAVLHDLNQAARYATHLVVMAAGRIVAQGAPSQILTAELVTEVFGLACDVIVDPHAGTPLIIPLPTARDRSQA
ncbi:iron complex transport system ATP-binding protein [Actinoalloteichus hoggarensis]|uniref:Putative siderophore transport system ATP-binding protein YusV n=1 Tax=Actinoalloteichus hoggarensis TaxID=1470176 RepID=A0A221W3X6_9PSEU|nr:ABC transporter ATP-binding protein [Actinoalloteichus hoggarensis]ASO20359.1 putative siderophore transport system ATP-binding protein YusV [Actinoalloteichus hoggarensis]MBB5923397.1 iron complex transport system ATP-binding protein [Actinoalloteichus hoggarensis]